MSLNLVLASREGPVRGHYQRAIEGLGVNLSTVSSLSELMGRLRLKPFSGVLLDVAVLLSADDNEKRALQWVIEVYPVVRLNWDEAGQHVQALYFGQSRSADQTVEGFIEWQCAPFEARTLRGNDRVPVHARVLLFKDGGLDPDLAERSVTLNLSTGGAYLLSFSDWSDDDLVWLVMPRLADQTPIGGQVKWSVKWQGKGGLPGIGVEFTDISSTQSDRIREILA